MRGYNYYGESYRYQVNANGIEVDLEALVLRITAEYTGFGKPVITREYPLLSLRVCSKCKAPVSIYAAGSLHGLLRETDSALFAGPTDSKRGWTALKANGGFALVAGGGHGFTRGSHQALEPRCHNKSTDLAFLASE